MSLMLGTGPFGQRPAGSFNFDAPRTGVLYWEDSPRRIRGTFAGETVVDSKSVKLLHESGHLPVYYFPSDDVRTELLEPSDRSTSCPHKGEAAYWSLRVGDRAAPDAAWSYPDPIEGAPPLAGHLAFYWDALDGWMEEDEEAIVHARDPYHRVDVLETSRRVRVSTGGAPVADTTRSRVLLETGLPPRWYIPRDDVLTGALVPVELTTGCAYKGYASYFDVDAGDERHPALAWTYESPRREAEPIAGYVCFFNERADIEVDGELAPRPRTPWSSPDWARRGRLEDEQV